jgi:hypothetical protein
MRDDLCICLQLGVSVESTRNATEDAPRPRGSPPADIQKRSSYTAAHKIYEAFWTWLAACILGICMAAERRGKSR